MIRWFAPRLRGAHFVFAVTAALVGCSGSQAPTAQAPASPAAAAPMAATVTIKDFKFSPAEVVVAPGGTVTWVNQDTMGHTATPDTAGQFTDTGLIAGGASRSVTFTTAGTYAYHCDPHPGMQAKVVVR